MTPSGRPMMILLRSALFNLFFAALTILVTLLGVVVAFVAPARLHGLGRLWARLGLEGLRVICGIRLRVSGREYLPVTEPALIAAQHQSAFDVLVWLMLLPRCVYVTKKELARIPLFGLLLPLAGMILVDRKGGAAALRGLCRDAKAAVAMGHQVVIFPEGTRVAPGVRARLWPGVAAIAAGTGLTVLPAVTDSGLVWGRRTFRKRPGTIHISVLAPLPVGQTPDELLAALARAFAAGVSKPVENSVG